MGERAFSLDDEAEFHAKARAGLIAGNALDDRMRSMPIRTKLEIWRRAGEGEDLVTLVAEAEATAAQDTKD